jgi:two-component system chemotaxis response regulator CheY
MTTAKTILTVDDSATMRDMLLATLSSLGYRVVQAADGLLGLETLEHEQPDVIITDINMPRLDGIGFIQRVRGNARHRATPILVLTTNTDPDLKNTARRAGATGWIVKPFDPQKLAEAIRRVMA